MKYLREWTLPDTSFNVVDQVERPDGWGVSFFWYCVCCGETYAKMEVLAPSRKWRGIGGISPTCLGNRWMVPGNLEGPPMVGKEVPHTILLWQLANELAFTDSVNHPYYEDQFLGT